MAIMSFKTCSNDAEILLTRDHHDFIVLLQSEIKFLLEAKLADGLMLLKLFQQQEISLDLHL